MRAVCSLHINTGKIRIIEYINAQISHPSFRSTMDLYRKFCIYAEAIQGWIQDFEKGVARVTVK